MTKLRNYAFFVNLNFYAACGVAQENRRTGDCRLVPAYTLEKNP
ncbi:hypothetical protein [Janthinobacterium sp. PC23-8]|nr:hypothetical protein [Janthinobacterium sp. PC23-8]